MAGARWISLYGPISQEEGALSYRPVRHDGPSAPYFTRVRSSIDFQQGRIAFDLEVGDQNGSIQPFPARGCYIRLGDPSRPLEVGLGVTTDGLYGIRAQTGPEWTVLAVAGIGESLLSGVTLHVEVRVVGSRVELVIDGVVVCTALWSFPKSQIELWMLGSWELTVRNFTVRAQKPVAFVVMQFGDRFDELYREVIAPTCAKFGFEVVRADDIYSNGLIIEDIVNSIYAASLVIADITPNNANVFYEVGFAHGIGKPTILMSDKQRERLPFDISGMRTLFYDNTIGGKSQVEAKLERHLESIVSATPAFAGAA